MNRLQQMIQDIESYGDDFDSVMTEYMQQGIVFISPQDIVICRYFAEEQDLFVYYAQGNIKNLLNKIDFPIKTISFTRKGWTRQYNYDKFLRRAINNN